MPTGPSLPMVMVGEVVGLHGVRGWVKLHSYTDPIEQIFAYRTWFVAGKPRSVKASKGQGRPLLCQLEGIEDRDQAARLIGQPIEVARDQLPELPEGEYYWCDLEGLCVKNTQGVDLGFVKRLFSTGANDVMVATENADGTGPERLIPWVMGQYVTRVDIDGGTVLVDWDPEF